MQHFGFTIAHPDYYEPFELSPAGAPYRPSAAPAGWEQRSTDVWTMWVPAGAAVAESGWKVHVSSSLANAQDVLDIVARVCAEFGIPFKHISGRRYFLWLHNKHGNRAQSGKFCALYPATPELAHELLVRLERELDGFAGPYVLTDRRFGSSSCVSYRYGAFRPRYLLNADGTRTPSLLDSAGRDIPDQRRPEFALPAGIVDPFAPPLDDGSDEPVSFGGYTFEAVVRHSNGGGVYRARTAGGREVFVKEARAHNGYIWDGRDTRQRLEQEYRTLRALHTVRPGLCPEPIDLFTHWENSYLVTELVPGITLTKWTVRETPVIQAGRPASAFAAYYRHCLAILDRAEALVAALHDLGYVFVDLNPNNILIDDQDRIRLVDFEAAGRLKGVIEPMGAPGYTPPDAADPDGLTAADPRRYDEYGLSAVAQMLLFPLHEVAGRAPEVLDHLHHDLTALAPVPERLWSRVTRLHPRAASPRLPSPEAVHAAPLVHLRWLRDRVADAAGAMARPDNPRWVYPTTPAGLLSNARCVAHGTAGVLHALRVTRREVDPRIVTRLRDDSLRLRHDTPPGLLFGNAGIAWVLADLGEVDAAGELLAAADRHPLLDGCLTLGGGSAGVALTHLSWYVRTGDGHHLDRARSLLDGLGEGDALRERLGADDASGLVHGRPGIALALYYLARLTGDDDALARGMALLRAELTHAVPLETDALGFRVSGRDNRNMPYLYAGSAGYVRVLARYLSAVEDDGLAEVLRRSLRACTLRFTVAAGLFQGVAGLGLALGETADLYDRPDLAAHEIAAGTALFKHAVPGPDGVRFLGDKLARLSADLWSGSAGILLALHRMVARPADPLFTLDAAVRRESSAGSRTCLVGTTDFRHLAEGNTPKKEEGAPR